MITADLARLVYRLFHALVHLAPRCGWFIQLLLLENADDCVFRAARTAVIPNITLHQDVLLANTLSRLPGLSIC